MSNIPVLTEEDKTFLEGAKVFYENAKDLYEADVKARKAKRANEKN